MNRAYAAGVAAVAGAAVLVGGTSFGIAMQRNTPPPLDVPTARPGGYFGAALPAGNWQHAPNHTPTCTSPDTAAQDTGALRQAQRGPGESATSWVSKSVNEVRAQRWMAQTEAAMRACAGPEARVVTVTERLDGWAVPITVMTAVHPCQTQPCTPHVAYAVGRRYDFTMGLELRTAEPVAAQDVQLLMTKRLGEWFGELEEGTPPHG